jgi:hypothetical protein
MLTFPVHPPAHFARRVVPSALLFGFAQSDLWMYRCYSGELYNSGNCLGSANAKLHPGDKITLQFDMDAGTLTYLVNGELLNLSFTDLAGGVSSGQGLAATFTWFRGCWEGEGAGGLALLSSCSRGPTPLRDHSNLCVRAVGPTCGGAGKTVVPCIQFYSCRTQVVEIVEYQSSNVGRCPVGRGPAPFSPLALCGFLCGPLTRLTPTACMNGTWACAGCRRGVGYPGVHVCGSAAGRAGPFRRPGCGTQATDIGIPAGCAAFDVLTLLSPVHVCSYQ